MSNSVDRGDLKSYYEDYWQRREDSNRLHTREGGYIPPRLIEVMKLFPQAASGLRVLDLGCGEGTLGMLLRKRYGQAGVYSFGCDISKKSTELAAPFYTQIAQMDIETDEITDVLKDQEFDFIVCVEILEHIFYPDRALMKLKEVLARGGRLIISFPNIAWWKYRLKLLSGHFPEESRLYHHAEHLHDFTFHTFSHLMDQAGLEVEQMVGEFIPPKFMHRCLPKGLLNRHMYRHPNLYGYQVVFRTKIKESFS